MEVIVYEMRYIETDIEKTNIECIPFNVIYFDEYKKIYNECFYNMRKSLDIKPYNYLSDFDQIADKMKDIYLLMENEEIIGSVACYGNEIDDLIVNARFQNQSYGRQLLLWGMQYIRNENSEPIILHVAEWNKKAIRLYKKIGFEIVHTEKIR